MLRKVQKRMFIDSQLQWDFVWSIVVKFPQFLAHNCKLPTFKILAKGNLARHFLVFFFIQISFYLRNLAQKEKPFASQFSGRLMGMKQGRSRGEAGNLWESQSQTVVSWHLLIMSISSHHFTQSNGLNSLPFLAKLKHHFLVGLSSP